MTVASTRTSARRSSTTSDRRTTRRCSSRSASLMGSSCSRGEPRVRGRGTTGTRSSRRTCGAGWPPTTPNGPGCTRQRRRGGPPSTHRRRSDTPSPPATVRWPEDLRRRWLELFLEGRRDALLASVDQVPQASPHVSEAHLAKALISVQRDRLGDARSALDTARALAVLLPQSDRAGLAERMALVELFVTGGDRGLGVAAGSRLAPCSPRSSPSPASAEPVVRASVQVFAAWPKRGSAQAWTRPWSCSGNQADGLGQGSDGPGLTALAASACPRWGGPLGRGAGPAVHVLALAEAGGGRDW